MSEMNCNHDKEIKVKGIFPRKSGVQNKSISVNTVFSNSLCGD